ncbi:MAG: transglycosylase SLT domain-containing protein [Pyrinomonadaceae bacterium]|nr:transglycosylase SLT domain-containing protein [Pyrinomonadaceae bacterium]MCX7639043.1 transglycosylase SLT domain-containing protein [Pyrinomonadaceae bacterium]MDW8303736.1 transglycosylase SLT domain-containing protein [Acidobacteriota bacterium]
MMRKAAIILLFLVSSYSILAQKQISGTTNVRPDNEVESRFLEISTEAGKRFKQALLRLQKNQPREAKEEFNRAVEAFIKSGININRSSGLFQTCYNQLIETIYRIEFPSSTFKPDIKFLSITCRWDKDSNSENDIDDALIADINKLLFSTENKATQNPLVESKSNNGLIASQSKRSGFDEQTFEPSPLDELAKLELTAEEQEVDSTQYEVIRLTAENRSLGFSFQAHPMIQQFINYYQGRGRQTMEVGLYRSGLFIRLARRIFREEGLPENLVWLGQVESMWKPTALSHASASGLWQFIPSTGIRFGLRQNAYVDERNSFEAATRAAARYLKFLVNRYNGNWELALAAYNSGEGNVDRAIARAGVANFWYAYPYLPRETRNYVPSILATILIANNPHRYGFAHIKPARPLEYDLVRVPPLTSLSLVAQASDTTLEYIRFLNPEFRSTKTPPEPYIVRVPKGKAGDVVAVLRRSRSVNQDNVAVVKVLSGETLEDVARRIGVSPEQLKAINGNEIGKQGKIIVPVSRSIQKTTYQRPSTVQSPSTQVQNSKPKIVKARKGDTIRKIAQRYGVSVAETGKINGKLPDVVLPEGTEVRLP